MGNIKTKHIVSIVFISLIFIQGILFFCIPKSTYDLIQNKDLKSLPVFKDQKIAEFAADFIPYYEDHLPFKNNYIEFSNLLKGVKINSLNTNKKVIIGNTHWLFYNACIYDSLGLNESIGLKPYSPEQIQKINTNLNILNAWCIKHNIKFLTVICPNKQSIYPEYMPASYNASDKTRLDQLLEANRSLIDLKKIFITYKKSHPHNLLYYKTDTHWNALGGALAAIEIQNRIVDSHKVNKSITFDVSYKSVPFGKDLANMLALKNHYSDTTAEITIKQSNEPLLDKLLILHDSYIESIEPALDRLFKSKAKRHIFNDGFPSPDDILQDKPNVFLILVVERYKEILLQDLHPDFYK